MAVQILESDQGVVLRIEEFKQKNRWAWVRSSRFFALFGLFLLLPGESIVTLFATQVFKNGAVHERQSFWLDEEALAQAPQNTRRANSRQAAGGNAPAKAGNQNNQNKQSAQNAENSAATESLVLRAKSTETESYLQTRIRDAISGLLTTPYSLSVKLNVDNEKLATIRKGFAQNRRLTPSDVDRLYLATIEQMSPIGFFANVKNKNITIIVDASTKEDTVKAVNQAISEAIDFDSKKGDKISVTKRDLSVEDSATKKKLEETLGKLTETETDLRSTKVRLESEIDQSRSIEGKNTILEQKNNELVNEVQRLKAEIEDLKAQLNKKGIGPKTDLEKLRDQIAGLEVPIAILTVALLMLLAMAVGSFIEGRRNKKKLTTLQEVVTAMSGSFETIGTSIVDAAKVFTKGKDTTESQEDDAGDADDAHVDVLERQASEAWEELQKKKPFVMEVLKDWIADKTKRPRFLQICEALGSAEAKKLWDAFPKEETNLLASLLDKPMTRAQAFKSVLLLGRFVSKLQKSKVPFFGELDTSILTASTDEKLAKLLSEQGSEAIATAMALMSPERSRRILSLLQDQDNVELLSQAQAKTELTLEEAKELLDKLSEVQSDEETEKTFDVTDHFANILEFGKTSEKRALMESLRDNPELLAKIQKQVITFDTVMKLDNEVVSEQLDGLEPEDIASLILSLDQNDSKRVAGFFNGKLLYRIQSEVARMQRSSIGKKRAEKAGEKIQKLIVGRVKKLVDEGLIEIKTPGSDGAGGGGQMGGQRAG